MTNIKKKLICSIVCLAGLNAMAQITIDDCQKWARENYPEVRRHGIIDATEACNLSNASKNWLPMVSIYAQGGWINKTADLNDISANIDDIPYKNYVDQTIDELGIKPLSHWQYRAGVEVVQPIYDGGATSLQRAVARKQAETDRAKIEVSLHELDMRVLDVYFALLLLEDRKEQVKMRSELLEKNIQKLRNLEKEGIAKPIDVQALEVEQIKLQQSSDLIDENISVYRSTMSLLTGHDISSGSIIRPIMPSSEPVAYSETAEMQLLNRQSELLSLKIRYEKVKIMPKLGFMGQMFYGFPGNNIFRDLVKHTPQVNIGLGLKLTWDISPLYKRSNNRNLIRYEQETIDNARQMLVFRQRITNTSMQTRLKRLNTIRQQDDKIVELRKKLRIAEEAKVDNDIVDATELLSKIGDEADAKLQRSIHETEIMHDAYKLMLFGDPEN